jgi:hypothetical protein
MRHALAVVLAAIVILEPVGTAHADTTGWTRYKEGSSTYVKWHTRFNPGQAQYWGARLKAIRRARRAHYLWILRYRRSPAYAKRVIRAVFGRYGWQAISVSRCESGWHTWARNGQYRGLFQMGASERARFGHGSDALTQARAAYRYFVASGRDWSPWACKP